MNYNSLIALNYQVEEAFLKTLSKKGISLSRDEFLKLIALFSSHFVDVMQRDSPEMIDIKEIYKEHYKNALKFWEKQPIGKYPDFMPENTGEA